MCESKMSHETQGDGDLYHTSHNYTTRTSLLLLIAQKIRVLIYSVVCDAERQASLEPETKITFRFKWKRPVLIQNRTEMNVSTLEKRYFVRFYDLTNIVSVLRVCVSG